ncbi:MAG: 2-phospho-L-lactate guanylyltransferase [Motilibacteraceae bacterium]
MGAQVVPGEVVDAGQPAPGPAEREAGVWSGSWVVAIPLKTLAEAKSRIRVPAHLRADLALAMALDTASAALDCPSVSAVWVVLGDAQLAPAFTRLGCSVIRDPRVDGLNGALGFARRRVRTELPGEAFASLVADLPAVTGEDLTFALDAARGHDRSFVPDASGTGTTLLASLPHAPYVPAYGRESARAHEGNGAARLQLAPDSPLRCDVDTVVDLERHASMGAGPRTARLLAPPREDLRPRTKARSLPLRLLSS